jgi:chaperonin GroES
MTTFHPRNDNVLVLPDDAKTMQGYLYLPPTAAQPTRGTVIAVGPGYLLADGTRSDVELTPGDRIEFQVPQGHPIVDVDGQAHFVLKEIDIIAVVTDEPPAEVCMPDGEERCAS